MRKIVLVALLPALLAVSACQFKGQSKVNNLFLEDTLAHEEIFGSAEMKEYTLQPKFAPSDPVQHPDAEDFSIGVQTQPGETEGTISFRFVAPVAFAEGQLTPTQAKWTRTVTAKDGSASPKTKGQIACTTAYNAISNGGGSFSISDYNTAHSTSYTHFVVYTLRNVPVDANDYYVSAYLALTPKDVGGEGGKTYTSKAVAINASCTEKYAYVHDSGAYFICGTHAGKTDNFNATAIRVGSDKAKFEYIDFDAGDVFTINEFYDTEFFVHGADECLDYGGEKINSCFEDDGNGKLQVKAGKGGSYGLYLNVTENDLYTEEDAPHNLVESGWFISGSFNSWPNNQLTVAAGYQLYYMRNKEGNWGWSRNVVFFKGDQFKVTNGSQWRGWHSGCCSGTPAPFSSTGDGENIKCEVGGTYKIYLSATGNGSIYITAA